MKISRKTIKTLKTIGCVLLAVLALGLVINLFTSSEPDDGYEKTVLDYDVGGITAEGVWDESVECALYTKEIIECTGIELCADFDSDISYTVFFYDENGKFVSSTKNTDLKLTVDSMPENATGVRIMIEPLNDDNGKIGLFEKIKYANQLSVRIRTTEVTE